MLLALMATQVFLGRASMRLYPNRCGLRRRFPPDNGNACLFKRSCSIGAPSFRVDHRVAKHFLSLPKMSARPRGGLSFASSSNLLARDNPSIRSVLSRLHSSSGILLGRRAASSRPAPFGHCPCSPTNEVRAPVRHRCTDPSAACGPNGASIVPEPSRH